MQAGKIWAGSDSNTAVFKGNSMKRRAFVTTSLGALLALNISQAIGAQTMDEQSKASLETAMALMEAMGKGDMDGMSKLMADDMVWHNEGDKTMPWIGPWQGKEEIFQFLGVFSENLKTTLWENTDAFASGDTVAIFGNMNGTTTHSGKEIGKFTFALRVKVRDGQVVLWNWFEDSFAVSNAYHGK